MRMVDGKPSLTYENLLLQFAFATSGPDASSQMLVEASLNTTKTALF